MTENLHHSSSSGNHPSQNSTQESSQACTQEAAELANRSDRSPTLALEVQALQILDSSDDCIQVLDLDGRMLFINRGGQALLGIQDITPFLNTSWVEFWQGADQQAAIDAIAQASTGKVCTFQGYCPTLSGEPKWWDSKISPMRGADGQVERLLCISRDITERKQFADERKQAEEQSRESDERYRAIINQTVAGVACTDLSGKLTLVNQKYCDITGYSADELIQLRMQDITHPEDLPRNVELFSQMQTEGKSFGIEKRYIRKDGSIVWVNNSVSVIRDREGKPQSAVAIVLDITERKQAALSAEFLATVTQNLAEATRIEDIIQTIGEQLNQYLQTSICAFVEINESKEVAAIHHSWHQKDVPNLVGVYPLAEFVTDEFFQTAKAGRSIIVCDVTTDPRIADPKRFAPLKIGSFINVPLIQENEWKFILGVYHQTPYNWRSDEMHVMHELANRIWGAIERAHAEAALRESEAKYRGLFESLDEGYFLADVIFDEDDQPIDIFYLEANPAATRMVGQDFTRRRLRELAPSYEAYWYEILGRVAQTGRGERLEQYAEPDRKWYDFYVFKVGDENSRRVSIVFKDITERKRREAHAAFLAEISADFSRLSTTNEIMQTVGAKIGAYLQITTCNFTDVDEARDRVTVYHGWSSPEVPSTVGTFRTSQYLSKEFEQASRAGETVVICNTQNDPRTDAAAYAAINMHSFVTVPFHRHGRWTHYIAICHSQPRDWHEDEIQLIEDISNRIFPRLQRARIEEALRGSEAKYRSLFESIDEGFCLIEVLFDEAGQAFDHRFLEANPAFEKHTGLVDVVGKTMRELVPHIETYWFEIYGRIALTGVPERFENAAQAMGRFYDVYAFRMGEPHEHKVAVLFSDINDRKQAEAAIAADLRDTQLLRDLSARLTTETDIQVLYDEILAAAIALTQADAGSFQFFNQATQELLLLATQGIDATLGEPFNRLSTSCHTSCGLALKTGERAFVDFDVPASEDLDGSMRLHVEAGLISAQSTPLLSRSGELIGMVSTHWRTRHRPSDRELRFLDLLARQAADLIEQRQDETQRKQLLKREQAARAEAEQANRIKDEFLAVLSHELRSPLNPILGWAKLLQNGKLDPAKTAQALATIERNAKLQSELIEDLLDVSRILRGKLSLNVAPVNLAATIRGAMETVRLAADAKSINLQLTILDSELKDEHPPTSKTAQPNTRANVQASTFLVSGDSTRLQQVVWNLLSNAVKFTPEGGHVEVKLERVNEWMGRRVDDSVPPPPLHSSTPPPLHPYAHITVSDTGQGIAPDFLPYVFDYFRQADGATTRKFGGLGLGLAIVRHLVELHGGTVRVDSLGAGQGATFTVRLPLMPTPLQANQDERSPQPPLNLNGIKILVVDDEADTRDLVAFVLEQQGAQVTVATSAHEALLMWPQSQPDILLSDIGMPEIDGYMLIQRVRALAPEQGGKIPAIALTAYAGETDQQRVIAAGFQKHIPKPIEPEELVQAIVGLVRSTHAKSLGN